MTSRHHMQTPLTTEAMSHASELSKVAQSIASRPQFSANIKTWQERAEENFKADVTIYEQKKTETVMDAMRSEIADLRAALAAKAVHDGWQPIETAPKDGSNIFLWWRDAVQIGKWLDNTSTRTPWAGWKAQNLSVSPFGSAHSHWMPLPPAPALAQPNKE